MGRYTAKLTGESDGHTEVRHFDDFERAKAWLQGEGLLDFDDQLACGEILEGGEIKWKKSSLQTHDRAERDDRARWDHFLADFYHRHRGK
jgi:hypothetical protein